MPKTKPMSDAMLEAVALRFGALAEPERLRLLRELLAGERSVNDLTAASGFSQANTSKHLATLHAAGFLSRRKDGTAVLYSVADPIARAVRPRVRAHRRGSARERPATTAAMCRPPRTSLS